MPYRDFQHHTIHRHNRQPANHARPARGWHTDILRILHRKHAPFLRTCATSSRLLSSKSLLFFLIPDGLDGFEGKQMTEYSGRPACRGGECRLDPGFGLRTCSGSSTWRLTWSDPGCAALIDAEEVQLSRSASFPCGSSDKESWQSPSTSIHLANSSSTAAKVGVVGSGMVTEARLEVADVCRRRK
jgi:hypothetical protein